MINGCTFTLGIAVLAAHDARRVAKLADVACALSMEAMRGEMGAFDPRIHEARNHPGQIRAAENICSLLEGSQWTTDEARRVLLKDEVRVGAWQPRVQDAYSLRCVPQVHGAVLDVLEFVEQILVMDEEIGGMARRFRQGLLVNQETLAVAEIQAKGPGSHFLDTDHTLQHFKQEFWRPAVCDRQGYQPERDYTKYSMERAKKVWQDRLANYTLPLMPPAVQQALLRYYQNKFDSDPNLE